MRLPDLNSRWEKAEADAAAKARVAELEAENERLLSDYYGGRTYDYEASERRWHAAESELADLRGRVALALTVYSYFEIDLPAEVALRRIAEVLRGR